MTTQNCLKSLWGLHDMYLPNNVMIKSWVRCRGRQDNNNYRLMKMPPAERSLKIRNVFVLFTKFKYVPVFIFRWVSTIWKSSGGCGILPDSIFDQTGILSTVISNAPVDTNWVSTALLRKKQGNLLRGVYNKTVRR